MINKPAGVISKNVSRWFVKTFGSHKIGHLGTLDPMASGVLPLLLGRATRLQDLLLSGVKEYEFELTLGYETDTLDAEGEVVKRCEVKGLSEEGIKEVLQGFQGLVEQLPPVYSAVKYLGKPLYYYARNNRLDELPMEQFRRQITIDSIELIGFAGHVLRIRVRCSKGTYIRVLGQQIAKELGVLGTITGLVRNQTGCFHIQNSVTMAQLEEDPSFIREALIPIAKLPLEIPQVEISQALGVERLIQGQPLSMDPKLFENEVVGDTLQWSQRSQVLLIDGDGIAFGLGERSLDRAGRVMIAMRKGL